MATLDPSAANGGGDPARPRGQTTAAVEDHETWVEEKRFTMYKVRPLEGQAASQRRGRHVIPFLYLMHNFLAFISLSALSLVLLGCGTVRRSVVFHIQTLQ